MRRVDGALDGKRADADVDAAVAVASFEALRVGKPAGEMAQLAEELSGEWAGLSVSRKNDPTTWAKTWLLFLHELQTYRILAVT